MPKRAPRAVVETWVGAFNRGDPEELAFKLSFLRQHGLPLPVE